MLRTYPGLFLLGTIVPGILLGDLSEIPAWAYMVPMLTAGLAAVVSLGQAGVCRVSILSGLTVFLFSAFHFSILVQPSGPNHVAHFANGESRYRLFGQVVDWPELKAARTEVKVRLDSLVWDRRQPVKGSVLLKIADTTTVLQRGDRIDFYGRIYPLRDRAVTTGFDYNRYLQLKGIHGLVYLTTLLDIRVNERSAFTPVAVADKVRHHISVCFADNLGSPAAALASGFLIGETRHIPPDVYRMFRDTGTLHLLAVSGSNVALVVGFVVFLLMPVSLSRPQRALILMFVLGLFALLSYGEPSVIRASVMAVLVILAGVLGRRLELNQVIAMTAAVILLVDPVQLFDIGFQLSFVTAWGLIYFTPRVHGRLRKYHASLWYKLILFPVIISLIAQLCSTPLIAFYFNRIPLISVLANLIIVPLVSLTVIGVLCLLIADLVLPSLGLLVGSLIDRLLQVILAVLKFFGGEHIPVVETAQVPAVWVAGSFAFLALLVPACWSVRMRRLALLAGLIAVNIIMVHRLLDLFQVDDKIHCWVRPVAGGVAGIVKYGEASVADLILMGIERRDYPIDERILTPLLKELGISRVGAVFLMSADYDAIDDVIRGASAFGGERLLIPPGLEKSVREHCRTDSTFLPLAVWRKVRARPRGPGYYPRDNELLVQFGKHQLLFACGRPGRSPTTTIDGKLDILVTNRLASVLQQRWLHEAPNRTAVLICSKLAHRERNFLTAARDSGNLEVDSIVDLGQTGGFYHGFDGASDRKEP